jgi:hypothetical protein
MPRGSKSVEISIGVKPTRAQVDIAVVVVASSSTNAKLMAVGVDKNAVSRTRGDGVEHVTTPRLVASVWEKVEHVPWW